MNIKGAVKEQSSYDFADGMTLKDLIVLANGFVDGADRGRIQVSRLSLETSNENNYITIIDLDFNTSLDFKLMPYDEVNVRFLAEFSFPSIVHIEGEVAYPGSYAVSASGERIDQLIDRAGGYTTMAFLEGAKIIRSGDSTSITLMNLEEVQRDKSSMYNYLLKNGDTLVVPELMETVAIEGAIGFTEMTKGRTRINSPYKKGKRAGYYIKEFGGGYGRDAKRMKVYVRKSNGIVARTTLFGLIKPKVNNGDLILVQKRVKKTKDERKEIDWNRQIESLSVKLSGLATFWIVINNLFNTIEANNAADAGQ